MTTLGLPDTADLLGPAQGPGQGAGRGPGQPGVPMPEEPEVVLDPYELEEQFGNMVKSLQQEKQRLDQQYMLQMASQGRILDYTNRRLADLAQEDQQQSIALVSDSMPFVNWRAPGSMQQVETMLQQMGAKMAPEMAPHLAGLRGRAQFMSDQSSYLDEAKAGVSAAMDEQLQEMLAAGSIAQEGEEPRGGLAGAALQFGEGLTGSVTMGLMGGPRNLPPRERLAAAGQLALEKASKEWSQRVGKHPGRGHIEDVAIDEGAMRDVLSRFSVEHLEKRGKQYGLRDTTVSEVSRKMSELAGWLVPFGAAGKAGTAAVRYGVPALAKTGTTGAKVAGFMLKHKRAVEAIPTMLIFGAATKFADTNVMARAQIEQSGATEQEKEAARDFQTTWDAMVASATVPAAWIAGSLGRIATGGASKMLSPGLRGYVETTVGFPAAMEAANRSATATRDLVTSLLENDEQTERAAKIFSIANPTVRGHVESMVRALAEGNVSEAWDNALAYGKEVAIGAPVFAATHVMHMHAPQLLTRDKVDQAKREILNLLPPEQRAMVLAAMDAMVPRKAPPKADEVLVKEKGPEEAARQIVKDRVHKEVGEIPTPDTLKSDLAREAAYDAVEARELAVAAAEKYEGAAKSDRELAIGLKHQELERLREAREAIEAVKAYERGETPAERQRPAETDEAPEAVRAWVRDQLEGDLVRTEQAERLAARSDLEKRQSEFEDKLSRRLNAVGGETRDQAHRELEEWSTANLRPGDTISTEQGALTLDRAPYRDAKTGKVVLTGERSFREPGFETAREQVSVNLDSVFEHADLSLNKEGGTPVKLRRAVERAADPAVTRFLDAVRRYEQTSGVASPRTQAAPVEPPVSRETVTAEAESAEPAQPQPEREMAEEAARGRVVEAADVMQKQRAEDLAEARRQEAPLGPDDKPPEHVRSSDRVVPEGAMDPAVLPPESREKARARESMAGEVRASSGFVELQQLGKVKADERAAALERMSHEGGAAGDFAKWVLEKEKASQSGRPDPATMTPAEITKEMADLSKESSRLNDRLIAEGRGSETPSETRKKGDELSLQWQREADRSAALRQEIETRVGPGSRGFPSGGKRGSFGPRKTAEAVSGTSPLESMKKFGGERASAELLYRWLHEKTEGVAPHDGLYERMADIAADIDRMAAITNPQERAQALVRWSEKLHEELAGGAMAIAARTTKEGTKKLNALSDLEVKLFGPAESHGGFMGVGTLVKFVWPWARTGTNLRFGMTPANRQEVAERAAQLLAAESAKMLDHLTGKPDTGRDEGGKPHLPFLRRFAPSLESAHSWMGDLGVGMDHVFGKTHQNLATYHRGMFDRGGRLRSPLAEGEYEWKIRQAIQEGQESAAWRGLSEEGKRVATELVEQLDQWRQALVDRHPFVVRSERLLDVILDQSRELGAREAKLDLAVERGQKTADEVADLKSLIGREREHLTRRRAGVAEKLAEFKENYGLDNYVHAFRAESERGIGDYRGVGDLSAPPTVRGAAPMRRRRNLIPEAELEKDIRKIMWKYAREVIPALEYNGFLAQNHEVLWGRERALTLPDMSAASNRPHYFENGVYESLGRWNVDRGAETAERADGGNTLVLWRGNLGEKTSTPKPPPNLTNWETLQRELQYGNVQLVSTAMAPTRVTIRDGGFLTEALDLRVRDMQDALGRLRTLSKDHRMSVKAWTLPMRWVGSMLNTAAIGLFSIPTAMTAAAGATLLNGNALHPKTWMPTQKAWLQFMTRLTRARGVFGVFGKPAAEPMRLLADIRNGITIDFGESGKMRTSEAELAKMSPEDRKNQEMIDEGLEELVHSGAFQNSLAEWMTGRLLVEGADGSRVKKAAQSVADAFQWLTHLGYVPMQKFAEVPARAFLWIGKYMETRQAGQDHAEATRIAEAAVTAYHGQFNPVTQNAFYRGPLGPMFGGVQTWASHMMGRLAKAPKTVALKMASLSVMTLALSRWLGLDDDLTHVLGGSLYELPGIGRGIQTAAQGNLAETVKGTGWEELVKTGFLPGIPLPQIGGSPGFRLLEGSKDLAVGMMSGQGDMAFDEAKRTLGGVLTPATQRWIHRSMFADPRPDGRFDLRQIYYAGLMQDSEPSYTLNSQGMGRLLTEARPGTPGDVAAQIHQGQILRSQQEVSKNRGTRIRREAGRVLAEFETRKKAGADTKEQRARWKELVADARADGRTLDSKSVARANKLRGIGYVGKAVAAADTKAGEILSLARVLENEANVVGQTDVDRIFAALRGQKTMRDWVNDEVVPADTRKRFFAAYKGWRARQPTR